MKVKNPLMSRFAHGTLGHELVFRRTPRGHTVYRHFKPKQPGTQAQIDHQTLFHDLANAWNDLSPAEQAEWETAAAAAGITAYNAYMAYNLKAGAAPPTYDEYDATLVAMLTDRWDHLTQGEQDYWIPLAEATGTTPYDAYMIYNLERLNPAQLDDLLAWWPNVVPFGSVLHDLTANRKDGEFVNLDPDLAWPHSDERAGNVIEYDGTGYVNVPTPPSVTTPFTVACWFKQNTYTPYACLVDTGETTNYTFGFSLAERMFFQVYGTFVFTDNLFEYDFDWHHLAGVWDGTQIHIYLDGTLCHSQPQTSTPTGQTTLYIGNRGVIHADVPFNGQMDDLRLYNRALELPDVAELAAT